MDLLVIKFGKISLNVREIEGEDRRIVIETYY